MIDRTDPATWAPAMVSVGVVGLVLVVLGAMAYSVAKKLRSMDQPLVDAAVERGKKKKRRPKKTEQIKALNEIEEHRDLVAQYHRAGGLLILGAYGAVAADIVISMTFIVGPVLLVTAALAALAIGGGLYLSLTKAPKFPPVPKDIA